MDNAAAIDDFAKRLLPLTYFRRNAGTVLDSLEKGKAFILTRGGRPFAKISLLADFKKELTREEKLRKLKKAIGGFRLGRGMTPSQMNKLLDKRYAEMLPR